MCAHELYSVNMFLAICIHVDILIHVVLLKLEIPNHLADVEV